MTITSCQKDDVVITETPVAQNGFTVTKTNSIIINNDSNLVTVLNKIASKKTKKSNSERTYYNETYGFEIDTEEGVLIEDATTGLKHYTFSILNNDLDFPLQNVVIKESLDGTYSSFISEYSFTERDYFTNANVDKSNIKYFPIDIDVNSMLNEDSSSINRCIPAHYSCIEVSYYQLTWVDQSDHDCLPGDTANCTGTHTQVPVYVEVVLGSNCNLTEASGCGGGTLAIDTMPLTTTIGTGSHPNVDNGNYVNETGYDVVTTPLIPKAIGKQIRLNFENSLTTAQNTYYNDPVNNSEYLLINQFLLTPPNGMTPEVYAVSQELIDKNLFAQQAIQALMQNTYPSFDYILNNRTDLIDNETGDINNNTIGNYDLTTYNQFQPSQEPWPSIEPVIPTSDFVGFRVEYKDDGNAYHCMDFAKEQIAKKGYQISNYSAPDQTIQIYTAQNGVNQSELQDGLDYLKYALENGIPVIVGVDNHSFGVNQNLDNTTDHFIVIVGMGTDGNGDYFQFYDNATAFSSNGCSELNKLYYYSLIETISGSSDCSYALQTDYYDYIITMIRKSKLID